MSVVLHRVSVQNFRAHTDADISFPETGLTTVIGDNGAGKSSLVSIAPFFALYGKAPSGVSLRSLRRQGAPEGDPTVVTVELTVAGRRLLVTRTMKGKNLTSMAEVRLDGELVTDTKTGAANDLVESLIGPADAFATVYLVAQKSLDALVTAKGADRRRLIEKLAGIDSLQAAVEEARGSTREAKGAVSSLPVLADEDVLLAGLDDALSASVAAVENVTGFEVVEVAAAASIAEAESAAASMELSARSALAKRVEFERLRGDARTAEALVTDASTRLNALLPVADPGCERVDTSEWTIRLEGFRDRFSHLSATILTIPAECDGTVVESLMAALSVCPGGEPVDVEPLRELVGSLTAEANHIKGTLAGLLDVCPTCGREADTASMRADLETELENVEAALMVADRDFTAATEWNEACVTAAALSAEYDNAVQALEADSLLVERRRNLEKEREELKTEAQGLKERLAAADATNTFLDAFENYEASRIELETALTAAQNNLDAARRALTVLGPEPDVDENAITAAQTLVAEKRGLLAAATKELNTARATHRETETAVIAAREAIAAAASARTHATQVRDSHRIAASVQDTLERFREQRIALLAPSLQDSSSDYINALSGGRFAGIELSEDFEPSVIDDDGTCREVSLLSGGEESLVALALRLAIGDEIVEGGGSMLVLDEVLGSMDEGRQALIVEALRRLDRQVIMVDHHGTPGDHTVRIERSKPAQN